MGKLVTDGADAARGAVFPQLTTDGIVIHNHIAWHGDGGKEIAGVGPEIACLDLIATKAGSDIDHLIHLAIAVPVVGREIGTRLCHSLGSLVDGVFAIVGLSITSGNGIDLNWTIDVELEVEQSF